MADSDDTEIAASSTDSTSTEIMDPILQSDNLSIKTDDAEPDVKKRKIDPLPDKPVQLEERLGGILCCAVCWDLPKCAVLQCTNGHLMCAGCFTHLLADARLRDEIATCPSCRIDISKSSASRNLAVEKAVSELPSKCQYCKKEFPRNTLDNHEQQQCEDRLTTCKYNMIGCPWCGPQHELKSHQESCAHPQKSGSEVMEALQAIENTKNMEKMLYENLFDLLSYEKIIFNELQMKPYRSEEFVSKTFYETSRFTAFNNQWVVKAKINTCQRDPTLSSDREMTFQLILKTKTTTAMPVHFMVLKGPFGDMKVVPKINKFEFTEQENESPNFTWPFADNAAECNRQLAAKTINFRLIMFLSSK